MVQIVRQYRKNILIRQTAAQLVHDLPGKDFYGEAELLFEFVRDHIRYIQDICSVETLYTPDQTLQQGFGDCDDMCTLLAALLESIGHKCRFLAIGFAPGVYSHVIVQTRIGTRWISADPTMNVDFGWTPPNIMACMSRHTY